jgi:hypothetical protein
VLYYKSSLFIPILLYLYRVMTTLKVKKATYRSNPLFPLPPSPPPPPGRSGAIPSQSLQSPVEQTLTNSLKPALSVSPLMFTTLHPRYNEKICPENVHTIGSNLIFVF